MHKIKKIIRNYILPIIIKLGVEKLILNKSKKMGCIINFHGVRKVDTPIINNRHIDIIEFEKIIFYLSKNFQIVPLSELFDLYRLGKKLNSKTISLTFDDGFLNNFQNALPILQKYNVPATFYLITNSLIELNYIAWPELYEIIKLNNKSDIEVNDHCFKKGELYDIDKKIHLVNYLKTLGNNTMATVNLILKKYQIKIDVPTNMDELFKLVNAIELDKYKNEPLLEFGSHTHTHPCLSYLDEASVNYELNNSKKILETICGKRINSIAYPDGSYNQNTIDISTHLGYNNIVAVDYKFKENNNNPNLLSRFTISNSTTFESNIFRLANEFNKYGF